MQYLLLSTHVQSLKTHNQVFYTFAAASRARDYLRSKGYVAAVRVVVACQK